LRQFLIGLILGAICIGVMMNPWVFMTGVIFDTRSVLLSIAGLFFGVTASVVATIMAGAYRAFLGGPGALAGVATVFVSTAIGLIWHRKFRDRLDNVPASELYFMGIIVHISMLTCQLLIPWPMSRDALSKIIIP